MIKMKIVIINGSARKGNTLTAIQAFCKGLSREHSVEIIQADQLHIAPCKGCDHCQCIKGCVDQDDTNPTIDKIVAADFILFASPVYWWGISAQLKQVIDKCYSKGQLLKHKKTGVLVVGAASVDSIQYSLIFQQFDCIAAYLEWNLKFKEAFSAGDKDALSKAKESIEKLEELGKKLC